MESPQGCNSPCPEQGADLHLRPLLPRPGGSLGRRRARAAPKDGLQLPALHLQVAVTFCLTADIKGTYTLARLNAVDVRPCGEAF